MFPLRGISSYIPHAFIIAPAIILYPSSVGCVPSRVIRSPVCPGCFAHSSREHGVQRNETHFRFICSLPRRKTVLRENVSLFLECRSFECRERSRD